jgi:signal transduction histidine kinase
VLATVVPLLLIGLAVFHPNQAAVGVVMLVVFTVGLSGGRRRSLIVGALMAPVVVAGVLITSPNAGLVADHVAYVALVLGALVAGDALRARRELLRVVAEEAERERDALLQHRFDQQRLRLAHELHDIVGHSLVAINVRAAAAAHRARHNPGVTETEVFDEIAAVSAEALAEVRGALKQLRSDETAAAPLSPAAELADVRELVAGVRGAGLDVDLQMSTTSDAIPSAAAHAAYRIVQEGLTNVLRHSTAGQARVRIEQLDGSLVIEVVDSGRRRVATPNGGGHGIQGMRERAAALGGTCEAGAVDGGGWRVRAELPTGDVGG